MKTLNDFFAAGNTKIWYSKNMRSLPKLASLHDTHVCLGSLSMTVLEEIYVAMQGDVWSPNGEARELIAGLGLHHTSMSVGDVVEIGGKFFTCVSFGFEELV